MTRQKKIEEKYQEMSETAHILARSGMYVGSTQLEESEQFVYNKDTGKMERKIVSFVPAMLKVVDEIISNSCDEFRRSDNLGLNLIKIDIDKESKRIVVYDNGGIPVVKHKEAGVYIPEFIFGRLRTSSNYDDSEDRNVVGTNGVGSSLTNCFSKYFCIDTCDGINKFHRSWSNNMQLNDDLVVEKAKKSEHGTKTVFELDFPRFHVDGFDDDFVAIIHKRCIDAAAANPGLKVVFNSDDEWKFKNFDEYLDLYSDYINFEDKIKFSNDLCTAYVFPDAAYDIGFVNGAECSKGTHMRIFRSQINSVICEYMVKKFKLKDLSPRSIENKYAVFMNITVSNPAYSSQTKEELTTQPDNFSKDESKKWSVDKRFLQQLEKSEIVNLVKDWYAKKQVAEDEKTLRKLNKEASRGLKRSDKFVPANTKNKKDRELWIYEGDSAARGLRSCRNPLTQGGYLMRGVVPNSLNMTPVQIMKNDVFNDLISILGLKFGEEFDINNLNYGRIVISTDADVDGDRICALVLLFMRFWPELFEQKIIVRSISPIIIAKKGKERKKFYKIEEFNKDADKLKGWNIKYCKGLSGLDMEETKDMMRSPIFMTFNYDSQTNVAFEKWFGSDADIRKQMMGEGV